MAREYAFEQACDGNGIKMTDGSGLAMGIIRSKKDRIKEQAEHAGLSKYRIFSKEENSRKVTAEIFWAKDDQDAASRLELFIQKNRLVNPVDEKQYFYGSAGGVIHDLGNGMEEEFDDMRESFRFDDETWLEKVKAFFMSFKWKFDDFKSMVKDFWFWFRHYDRRSGKSRQRYESWSLDSAVLDMLEFNIPLIMADKNGVPGDFCAMAKARSAGMTLDAAKNAYNAGVSSSDEEIKLGKELWNEELGRVLLHIRLYRYYANYGIVGKEDGGEYAKIDEEYSKTMPYKPGTDKDIDYTKLHELTQTEWEFVWDWWKKYGQMCWT